MKHIKQLKCSLPSALSNLYKAERFIDRLIADFQIPSSLQGRISVAIVEAVNNSMLHGNKQNPEKMITILAEEYRDRITVIIEDEGEGFDCMDIPNPTVFENITQSSGRGLYLMSSLSDELTFYLDGRKVAMSFFLNKSSYPLREICVIAIVLTAIWGFLFWIEYKEADMQEREYQQHIKEYDRKIEDDLLEWDYDCCPV